MPTQVLKVVFLPFFPLQGWHLALVKFSLVAPSCLTLCDPMKCSTPGLPVHHQLLEFTQTHKELLQTPAIYSQKNRPREPKEYRWYTREQQCLLPGNLGDFSILNHSTRFSSSGLPSSYHQSRERSTLGKHLTSVLPALNTQGSKGGRDNRKNKSSGSCPVIDDLLGPSSPSVPSPLLQLSTV